MHLTFRQKRIADRAHKNLRQHRDLDELNIEDLYEFMAKQKFDPNSDPRITRFDPDLPFQVGNLMLFDPQYDGDAWEPVL